MSTIQKPNKIPSALLIPIIVLGVATLAATQERQQISKNNSYDSLHIGYTYKSPKRVMIMSMFQPEGLEATIEALGYCMSAPKGIIFTVLDTAFKNDIIWYSVKVIGGPKNGWQNINGEELEQQTIQNSFENWNGIQGWINSLAFYPCNLIKIQNSQSNEASRHNNSDYDDTPIASGPWIDEIERFEKTAQFFSQRLNLIVGKTYYMIRKAPLLSSIDEATDVHQISLSPGTSVNVLDTAFSEIYLDSLCYFVRATDSCGNFIGSGWIPAQYFRRPPLNVSKRQYIWSRINKTQDFAQAKAEELYPLRLTPNEYKMEDMTRFQLSSEIALYDKPTLTAAFQLLPKDCQITIYHRKAESWPPWYFVEARFTSEEHISGYDDGFKKAWQRGSKRRQKNKDMEQGYADMWQTEIRDDWNIEYQKGFQRAWKSGYEGGFASGYSKGYIEYLARSSKTYIHGHIYSDHLIGEKYCPPLPPIDTVKHLQLQRHYIDSLLQQFYHLLLVDEMITCEEIDSIKVEALERGW